MHVLVALAVPGDWGGEVAAPVRGSFQYSQHGCCGEKERTLPPFPAPRGTEGHDLVMGAWKVRLMVGRS